MWFDDDPAFPEMKTVALFALVCFLCYGLLSGYPGIYLSEPRSLKDKVKLPDGKTLPLKRKSFEKNKYIQAAELNGSEFNRAWISHDEIVAGGTLVFIMGDRLTRLGFNPSVFLEMTAGNNIVLIACNY